MMRWLAGGFVCLAVTGSVFAQSVCLPTKEDSAAAETTTLGGRKHLRRADREAERANAIIRGTSSTFHVKRWIDRQFIAYDPDYLRSRAERRQRLDQLKARLDAAQKPGHWLYCSQELYNEADWLIEYTALWHEADRALDMLETSFEDPDQARFSVQSSDGSFGGCRREFIFRLDRTVSAFNAMSDRDQEPLAHPLTFLDRLASPNALAHLVFSRASSVIASTGVYAREEQASLNESLPQLLLKPSLLSRARENGADYFTPDYVGRYRMLLDATQDSVTGFWGPVLNGEETLFLPDLSMTYHIAAYRGGCISRWDAIWRTLLSMKDRDYPYGWLWRGRVTPHNAYDVVRLFKLGWTHATVEQKAEARRAIADILSDVLAHDIAPNGRVRFDPAYYETEAAAYYFAIAFLDVAGFWRPDPFWSTTRPVEAGALSLCHRLREKVTAFAGESPLGAGALARLQTACP